ncbi:hypothetical protein A1O3_08532 [Capronia epimyces CBS 606.96]|uniref:Uncharacterized protein n=1 Tax=Capronia epimyces CBS 606.96 TaxID=1182542 RepID=W9XPX5_9EURO|nr:uncharacterized protein A1O3_08532 [Capronia epimyces CBS 606.96]EXJ79031.1 hypothetical protein A1O3_08532 [Capronia epimyces CBS 606.96]
MSLGIIKALWTVCMRCRDPVFTRRALSILWDCRRREGVWSSPITALVVERIMHMEEEAARRCLSATDGSDVHLHHASQVLEHVRIRRLDPTFGPGRQAKIRYTKSVGGSPHFNPDASDAVTVEEVIRW